MAKKTRINESGEYDPYTSRGPSAKTDNVVPIKAGPAEDAVKAMNFAKFVRAEDKLAEDKADFKSVVKHVEGKGVNPKAAAIATKILRQGSVATSAFASLIRDVLELLEIGGSPIAKEQIEMFPGEEERTPAEERAKAAGRRAAFFDKASGDNPYDPTSGLGQAWIEGFHGGNAEADLIRAMERPEVLKGSEPGDDPFAVVAADPSKVAAE